MGVVLYTHMGDNPINYLEAIEMKNLDTNQYIDFIKNTIATEGYKVADTANKMALEMKRISTEQYSAAARLIADAFLKEM